MPAVPATEDAHPSDRATTEAGADSQADPTALTFGGTAQIQPGDTAGDVREVYGDYSVAADCGQFQSYLSVTDAGGTALKFDLAGGADDASDVSVSAAVRKTACSRYSATADDPGMADDSECPAPCPTHILRRIRGPVSPCAHSPAGRCTSIDRSARRPAEPSGTAIGHART